LHDWTTVDKNESPFRVVCKLGPKCSKHEWGNRSPMMWLGGKKKNSSKMTKFKFDQANYF